jgi:hypothetical protein
MAQRKSCGANRLFALPFWCHEVGEKSQGTEISIIAWMSNVFYASSDMDQ